jgi:hypothetical protein
MIKIILHYFFVSLLFKSKNKFSKIILLKEKKSSIHPLGPKYYFFFVIK